MIMPAPIDDALAYWLASDSEVSHTRTYHLPPRPPPLELPPKPPPPLVLLLLDPGRVIDGLLWTKLGSRTKVPS